LKITNLSTQSDMFAEILIISYKIKNILI